MSQLAEFFDLCERMKVAVRVDRDAIDTSTATGKRVGNVLASLAQFESDVASERVRDAFTAKRARDPGWIGPGSRGYGEVRTLLDGRIVGQDEDVDAVARAFAEARSFDGAARLLNASPLRPRRQDAIWHGTTVAGILKRADPDRHARPEGRGVGPGRVPLVCRDSWSAANAGP